MTNRDSVFGARLVGHLYGGVYNARIRPYVVPATDAVALFVGDCVKLTGTGATNELGQALPIVAQAAAEEVLVGVVVGFMPHSSYLGQIYRTASTLRTVYVCDDPYAIFEIQTNGVGAVTDFGSNADIVVGAGNTIYGTSGMELDEASVTAATAQLRILGLSQRPDNELGQDAKFICMINEHYFKQTAGV